jgi:hypothetical protein
MELIVDIALNMKKRLVMVMIQDVYVINVQGI